MAPIKLYYYPAGAPSRAALLSARAIGVPLDLQLLDLLKKEQFSENYLKLNPQHCVPTMDDNGFILWESRAIACYLADTYGQDDKLYPKDTKQRAIVNQRLYFDASSLLVKVRAICHPILFQVVKEISKSLRDDFNTTLGFLNKFLENSKWVAGDNMTIADCCIYATLSGMLAIGWDISEFSDIQRWVQNCKSLPGYEENQAGANAYASAVKRNLES